MSDTPGGIEEVGAELEDIIASEFRGLVVDFWSPWCAPCRPLKRQLARIADEQQRKWRFVAVNTEAHPVVSQAFGVRALPTVVLFRKAVEAHRFSGTVLPSDVEKKIEELG